MAHVRGWAWPSRGALSRRQPSAKREHHCAFSMQAGRVEYWQSGVLLTNQHRDLGAAQDDAVHQFVPLHSGDYVQVGRL